MPLPRPSQRDTGVSLTTVDLVFAALATLAVKNGDTFSELAYPAPEAPFLWLIDRITVAHTSINPTNAFVFVGEANAQSLRDSTTGGNADVADYAAGVYVPPTMPLRIRWTAPLGLNVGAIGTATLQYRLMQRDA